MVVRAVEKFGTVARTLMRSRSIIRRNTCTSRWSLYWANAAKGALGLPPVIGQFKNGRGEFYDQEDFNGRAILFDTCGLISHRRRRILNNRFRTMGERRGKRTGSLIRLE